MEERERRGSGGEEYIRLVRCDDSQALLRYRWDEVNNRRLGFDLFGLA